MRKFFILLVTIIEVVNAQQYDQFKPYLHKPSVGDIPKLETFGEYETELFSGAGTYTYEIEVPPGTNNLQPSLAFLYNSQSTLQRPGMLGSGWSLTENYIIRNVNHTLDDINDDYFILSMSNTRLKIFYNGTSFNTEIDPRKFKIE